MRDGKIAESGTFAELYKPGKEFYSLFRPSQSAIGKKSESATTSDTRQVKEVDHDALQEDKVTQSDESQDMAEEEKQKRLSWSVFKGLYISIRSS